MLVSYAYDMVLPSRYAASIQILNTCRALCTLGASVDVYVRGLEASAAECLAYYGLAPHVGLRIVPLGEDRPGRMDLGGLRTSLSERGKGDDHAVILRGEPGLRVFSALRGSPRGRSERHVYEAHRLCFTHHTSEPRLPILRRVTYSVRRRRVRKREQTTLGGVDGVVCLTQGVREALETEFGIDRPTVILPSGTSTQAGDLPPDQTRDIDLAYVGKLARRKGVCQLVEALRDLHGVTAWVVGGSSRQVAGLQRAARRLGVVHRVVAPGHLPPSQVRQILLRARVGVCPLPLGESEISERFSSPLKILDMMATGVPIVATDLPTVRALLDESTAVLVPPNDPKALARGVASLLADRETAQALAARARERVESFSWTRRAGRLLTFLEALG